MELQEYITIQNIKLILRDQTERKWIEIQHTQFIKYKIQKHIYMIAYFGIHLRNFNGHMKNLYN